MNSVLKILVLAVLIAMPQYAIAQKGKGQQKKAENLQKVDKKIKKSQQQNRPVKDEINREEKILNDKEGKILKDREEIERERDLQKEREDTPDDDRKKDKKGKKDKKIKEVKEQANNGKGNAYGRNKGGLSGKEFGQERAAQARLNKETKRKELETTVEDNTTRTRTSREKVNEKLEELKKMRKKGEISEKDYGTKIEKIDRVQEQIIDLEEKIKKAKDFVLDKKNQ